MRQAPVPLSLVQSLFSLFLSLSLFLSPFAFGNDPKETPEDMAFVPGGDFFMGANKESTGKIALEAGAEPEWFSDEGEKRKVSVKPFFIDIYEVTNKKYSEFDPKHEFPQNIENHPVNSIQWEKANAFCKWAGKRLPSESEWEKAARGTDGRVYPWGNEFDSSKCNSKITGLGGSARVGKFKLETSGQSIKSGTAPVSAFKEGNSVYGVYNMAGNLWEWIDGWYDEKKGLRILKGGSWVSPPTSLRSSTRLQELPKTESNEYGFRCARTP